MSVAKRKTKSGYTKEYHYAFAQDGKRYRGVCEGCTTKREAEEFEKKKREEAVEALKNQGYKIWAIEQAENSVMLQDFFKQSECSPKLGEPTLEARAEGKLVCIMPCKEEEDEVKVSEGGGVCKFLIFNFQLSTLILSYPHTTKI